VFSLARPPTAGSVRGTVTFEPPRMAGGGRVVRERTAAPSAVEGFPAGTRHMTSPLQQKLKITGPSSLPPTAGRRAVVYRPATALVHPSR